MNDSQAAPRSTPTRREVLSRTAAAGAALLAAPSLLSSARAAAAGPGRRKRYAHVGVGSRSGMYRRAVNQSYTDHAEMVGYCDINRGRLDLAQTARPRGVRRRRAHLHRQRLRSHDPRNEARHGDRYHQGLHAQPVHRPRDAARLRRDDREADDRRRGEVPRDPEDPARNRQALPRDVQLPLLAPPHAGERPADAGGDRRPAVGRLPLDAQHDPRRRLLPPLAQPQGELGRPDGPQGHAPLRPGQLVAVGRAGARSGPRQAGVLHPQDGQEVRPGQPSRAVPHMPREGQVQLLPRPRRA